MTGGFEVERKLGEARNANAVTSSFAYGTHTFGLRRLRAIVRCGALHAVVSTVV